MRAVLFTAMLAAALILGALAGAVFSAGTAQHFSEVSGNNGITVWRLDNRTGQVSICGSAMNGPALADAESQLATHLRAAAGNPPALAALKPEIDQLDSLSRPRCSPWSVP
jgi:hypothetical protein